MRNMEETIEAGRGRWMKKRADDRRCAAINMIHTTPSFKIGRIYYKGVLYEERLMMICKKELEDGKN